MSHTLRPATDQDLPFAFALYRELMHALTVELLPWNEEGQRNVVSSGIASGNVQLVLVDQEPVGWVQVNEHPDALELGQIYLRRELQGRGLGNQLIATVQRRAQAAGKPVRLAVLHNNPRARALYERLGFREVDRDQYKRYLRWEAAPVEILEGSFADLAEYSRVSIAFQVEGTPYTKDYDALPGNHPTQLPAQHDLSRWGLLAAWRDGRRVGGAILAFDPERAHLVVLWDLRVAPEARGQGIGRALFRAAEAWAVARGCRELMVETQDNNVAACLFYAACGCELGAQHPAAYPDLPDEVQMLWFKALS